MKKRLLVVIIILVSLIISSGCTEITYGFYLNGDGSVEYKYIIDIDPDGNFGPYDEDYAVDVATAYLEAQLNDNEYGEIIVDEDNPYKISLVYSYDSMNEYYRAMGRTGDDPPEPDNGEEDRDIFFVYNTQDVFTDLDSQYIYNSSGGIRANAFPEISVVPYEDITLNLEYGTKYTKLYKANADEEYTENNTKIYKWTMTLDDVDGDRTMTSRQANIGVWYSFAILSSVLISVVLYLLFGKGQKKNEREQNSL